MSRSAPAPFAAPSLLQAGTTPRGAPFAGATAVAAIASALLCVPAAPAHAQATVKPDGRFRAAIGLGASASGGNSRSTNLSFTGDGVRATEAMKTTVFGSAQYARTDGATSAERLRLGGRHDHDLSPAWFAFGNAELERNVFANLKLRGQVGGGAGYHLIRTEAAQFDLFGGLSFSYDSYETPTRIDGEQRAQYDYASLMFAEESNHKLNSGSTLKQRLVLLPNARSPGEYRATFDAGLAVALNSTLSLTVGLAASHNSEPGPDRKSTDTLLTSGIAIKFE